MSPKKNTQKSAKTSRRFPEEEKAAMRNRAKELKAEARANKAEGENAVLAAITALAKKATSSGLSSAPSLRLLRG